MIKLYREEIERESAVIYGPARDPREPRARARPREYGARAMLHVEELAEGRFVTLCYRMKRIHTTLVSSTALVFLLESVDLI